MKMWSTYSKSRKNATECNKAGDFFLSSMLSFWAVILFLFVISWLILQGMGYRLVKQNCHQAPELPPWLGSRSPSATGFSFLQPQTFILWARKQVNSSPLGILLPQSTKNKQGPKDWKSSARVWSVPGPGTSERLAPWNSWYCLYGAETSTAAHTETLQGLHRPPPPSPQPTPMCKLSWRAGRSLVWEREVRQCLGVKGWGTSAVPGQAGLGRGNVIWARGRKAMKQEAKDPS